MTDRPRVLLVGPYERDNFGDLLFLLVTEHCLWDAEVCAAAPFASDMSALLDRSIPSYAPLLRGESFDVVWSVGGQIGAIDARRAYRYAAAPDVHERFLQATRAEQKQRLRRAAGGATPLSPYIPSLTAYPRNAGAISVVNSAGIGGIAHQESGRRAALLALLRGQDVIAVRDRQSAALLRDEGIAHRLVPDAVHALGALDPAPSRTDPVAAVQLSSAIVTGLGHEQVARSLVEAESLAPLGLRLLAAGTATGHDSLEDLDRIAHHVAALDPDRAVEVVRDRRPLDLVERIRTAQVVISTSLHVRIVAAAYDVPRVTLAKRKPTLYARTWDRDMPYDVDLGGIDAAVARALKAGEDLAVSARTRALTRTAHEHMTSLSAEALALARTSTAADGRRRAAARAAYVAAVPAPPSALRRGSRKALRRLRSIRA